NNKFTGFGRSTDAGATFTDMGTLPTSTAGDAGDPAMARDNASGKIYFATLGYSSSNVVQVFRSADNGATFSAPVNGAPSFGAAVTVSTLTSTGSNGDLGLTVSNTNSTAFRTNAFPQAAVTPNGIYVTFNDKGTTTGDKADIFLAKSTDGGATWSKVKLND